MDSIGPECTELKHKYEACFNRWYSEKFLKGETRDECEPLFKAYKACLDKVLKVKKIDVMLDEHARLSSTDTRPSS